MRLWCIYPSIYALHCTIRQNLVNLAHNDHLLSFCLNHAQGQVLWELFSFHKNHFFSETRFVCPMYDCLQILFIFIIADQSQQKTYTKQYHVMGHMVSSWHHWCSRYAIEAKVENISLSLSWGFNVFLCFIWHNISIYYLEQEEVAVSYFYH